MALPHPETLFDNILDFLASTPTPENILDFEPSKVLQQRMSYLLEQNRHGQLTTDEQQELEEFLRINRLMSRLKLRARLKLTS